MMWDRDAYKIGHGGGDDAVVADIAGQQDSCGALAEAEYISRVIPIGRRASSLKESDRPDFYPRVISEVKPSPKVGLELRCVWPDGLIGGEPNQSLQTLFGEDGH